ncbi:MAG: photopigment and puc expression activator [Glaciihabitans sp.]|nr:photopigment and puc expression activator [Glaciihabitans sp.]
MLSIVYVSVATRPMTDQDVAGLLVQARANNLRDGLTGALLYRDGRFIQILEGPDEQVRVKFATIATDSRHRSVHKMNEKAIGARQFPDWTMGFRPMVDDTVKQLAGFDGFFENRTGKDRLKHAENEAQQLLEWLAEYWLPRT